MTFETWRNLEKMTPGDPRHKPAQLRSRGRSNTHSRVAAWPLCYSAGWAKRGRIRSGWARPAADFSGKVPALEVPALKRPGIGETVPPGLCAGSPVLEARCLMPACPSRSGLTTGHLGSSPEASPGAAGAVGVVSDDSKCMWWQLWWGARPLLWGSCGAAGCWRRKGSLAEHDAGRPARDAGGRERRDECPRHLPTPLALLQGNGRSARVEGHDQGCSWGLFCGGCSKGPGPSFGAVLARFGAGAGVTRPWGTRGMPARPSPGPVSMGRVWG